MAQAGQMAATRLDWRAHGADSARLLLESVVTGTFVSVVLGLAVFIVATQASAATGGGEIRQGTLLLRDAAGVDVTAPLVFTDVHMDVSGMTARVRVTQRFVNPTTDWREGVYVFPLPEKAAVDHLRHAHRRARHPGPDQGARRGAAHLRGGEGRREEGGARRAGAAEHVHDERRAHRARRGDRRRPSNTSRRCATTPGASRCASRWRSRRATSRERRIADGDDQEAAHRRRNRAATDAVPDADRITPPVVVPGAGAINPVSLDIDLDAGFPLAKLDEPHITRCASRIAATTAST